MSAVAEKRSYNGLIAILSVVLVGAVAFLYVGPAFVLEGFDYSILPPLNAAINGLTTLLLIAGFMAIKNGNIARHKQLMTTALVCSVVFLLSYVAYHSGTESTKFGGEGIIRGVYFFILISHILLAIAITPLVLITLVRAWSERFDKHRKIAKITLPLWLYVSVTGVIVYFMIAPYYGG